MSISVFPRIVFPDDMVRSTSDWKMMDTWMASIITMCFYGTLFLLDMFIAIWHAPRDVWWWKGLIPWINDVDESLDECYHTMFGELNRGRGRLIRCVGNSYSNFLYLWMSLVILLHYETNIAADTVFGINLFILAISSTAWHGTHIRMVQYIDLWSMENVILYLLIRFPCRLLFDRPEKDLICVTIYSLYSILNAQRHIAFYQNQYLHTIAPIAGRTRLLHMVRKAEEQQQSSSNEEKEKENETITEKLRILPSIDVTHHVGILDLCVFSLFPVMKLILLGGLILYVQHNNTHIMDIIPTIPTTVINRIIRPLIFGWTYRLLERWIFDCIPYRSYWSKDNSIFSILLSAAFSPTAIFHFLTGVCLWNGYLLALYLDQ